MQLEEEVRHYRQIISETECEKLKSSRDVRLWQVFVNAEWVAKGVRMEYQYDLGEQWDHVLHFMGQADPMLGAAMDPTKLSEQSAFCIGGKGAPEDEDRVYPQGGRRDLYSWDVVSINKELKKLCRLKVYNS